MKIRQLFKPGIAKQNIIESVSYFFIEKPRFRLTLCCLMVLLISSLTLHAQSTTATIRSGQNKIFRAGAAMSNITPPLGEGIVGGCLKVSR